MWIIALDGSKGAGKSTLVDSFLAKNPDTLELSLDKERRALGIDGTSFEKNKTTFASLEKKLTAALRGNRNVIVDCGLYEQRIQSLRELADQYGATLHMVFLTAPYEVLVNRVTTRDKSRGRTFNKARFDEVYALVNDKDLSEFTVLDSGRSDSQALTARLLSLIN